MNVSFPLDPLRPVYTLAGDESWVRDQFLRQLRAQVPEATLAYGWMEADLGETTLESVLDGARNDSLMTPLQVFWLRNARELFSRGGAAAAEGEGAAPAGKKKHGNFPANLQAFAGGAGEPPGSVLVFVADHIHIPADRARMGLEDKARLQRMEATLGMVGPVIVCAQASEAQAVALAQQMAQDAGCTLTPALARRLVELCNGSLARLQQEIEKLALYTQQGVVSDAALAALVSGGTAASAFDLAQQIARGDRAAALSSLASWWREEGAAGAVGLIFQLSRAFSMALIVQQERVRDRSGLYRVLPEGLRPPGFAADTVLAIAQHMHPQGLREAIPELHRADVALRSSPPSVALLLERTVTMMCQ
ncbi:MAG: DNA polymerase III subunit delta [Terriglobales bacterium]